MNAIDFAWFLAETAHSGQEYKRKNETFPYIKHVFDVQLRVANLKNISKSKLKKARIVAILHDVFEDSKIFKLGEMISVFNQDIVDALYAITKKEGEDYFEYISRVNENEIARIVKGCDLNENLISSLRDSDERRINKYRKALEIIGVD